MPVLNYLEELASHIKIEEQHVVVLDWLNGNRSILSNSHLTEVSLVLHFKHHMK